MKNLIPVSLVYGGLLVTLLGAISVVSPLRLLAIQSRATGVLVLFCGVLIFVIGATLPADETRVATARTKLDEFAPVYQFSESHSVQIGASKGRVYEAIRQVPAGDIKLLRTLTWIRRLGRATPPGILNAPQDEPVLEVALRSGFLLLADDPDREIVIGALVRAPAGWRPNKKPTPDDFKSLNAPGFALASMNFRIEEAEPDRCVVTTDTRVFATDPSSRRKFGEYWRMIYPGSALIRRMWLQAIKKRAENGQKMMLVPVCAPAKLYSSRRRFALWPCDCE
jgi:hypothetical protein